MICPNCGRRNPAGATFCSRCRQRLPLAGVPNGGRRHTVMVEPRGAGGGGALVLAVALLAGFLFVGGALAIYLSSPQQPTAPPNVAQGSAEPSLPIFEQQTPTPTPSPTPTFIVLTPDPFASPTLDPLASASPSFDTSPTPTTDSTPGPTNPPTDAPAPVANFTRSVNGLTVQFNDQSTGPLTSRSWDFGDGTTGRGRSPSHTYPDTGPYTVTLTVTGPGGTSSISKTINNLSTPAPTAEPTASPTASPSIAPPSIEPPPEPDPPADSPPVE